MDITIEFTGYTILGQVDLSEESYDSEAAAVVLWDNTTGSLSLLIASGCQCCTNLWDDVTPADAETVGSLDELAQRLFTMVAELTVDDEDRQLSVSEVIETVRTVALALAGRVPAIQS